MTSCGHANYGCCLSEEKVEVAIQNQKNPLFDAGVDGPPSPSIPVGIIFISDDSAPQDLCPVPMQDIVSMFDWKSENTHVHHFGKQFGKNFWSFIPTCLMLSFSFLFFNSASP